MTEDERRALLRQQIDAYHAGYLKNGSDRLLAQVAYELAIADLESWDLRGLVPVSVWVAMTDAQQYEVKEMWHFRAVLQMCIGAVFALMCVVAYQAVGLGALIIAAGVSGFGMLTIRAYLTDTSHGWDAMTAPGTASSLNHAKRLYTEANAQLTRQGMRGALTDSGDAVHLGGGLSMVHESGALEVCDD